MLKGTTAQFLGFVILSSVSLTACTSGGQPQAAVNKGTVPLAAVRVGTPESIFKEAEITFVPDPNGAMAGKTQYLSRFQDENGGQYVVQAKNDVCYEVNVIHATKPIAKEVALQTLQRLLPANVTDKAVISAAPANQAAPIESYLYGKNYIGRMYYADKDQKDVKIVSLTRVPNAL